MRNEDRLWVEIAMVMEMEMEMVMVMMGLTITQVHIKESIQYTKVCSRNELYRFIALCTGWDLGDGDGGGDGDGDGDGERVWETMGATNIFLACSHYQQNFLLWNDSID